MENGPQVTLPLDKDGFLSQECPACERRFKVKPTHGTGRTIAYCPYCSHHGKDCWWTKEQAAHVSALAAKVMSEELNKGMKSVAGFTWSAGSPIEVPPVPSESQEPSSQFDFPCCSEAVKISATASATCIICGRVAPIKGSAAGGT